ncbi:MAG: glycosyltransferase family 4 protein [Lentisphaerae bacterium]|nr:glycosyltransferase family 4 protein [Lentisphaerota bacterium]
MPRPIVLSLYGRDLFGASGAYRKALTRLLSYENVYVHVTSEAMRPSALELGSDPDRLAVVHVGIGCEGMPGPDAIRSRIQARRSVSRLKIVTVGRLVEVKAPHKLPAVAAELHREGIDFEWVVVGDGPLRSQLEENCRRFDVADRFRIMGELPHSDIQPLLEECDMMVFNSVITPGGDVMESLGVSLMEGGACGLPIVSCRVGGIPEVVADGETGFLVESGNLERMTKKIVLLASDGDLRTRMGLAAAERIRSLFDSELLAQQMESFYDLILTRHGGDRT